MLHSLDHGTRNPEQSVSSPGHVPIHGLPAPFNALMEIVGALQGQANECVFETVGTIENGQASSAGGSEGPKGLSHGKC